MGLSWVGGCLFAFFLSFSLFSLLVAGCIPPIYLSVADRGSVGFFFFFGFNNIIFYLIFYPSKKKNEEDLYY